MKKINTMVLSIWCLLAPCLASATIGSGGQDAGNGGGFVVFENQSIFYDFHYENEAFNPDNWKDLSALIENNLLMRIDIFGDSDILQDERFKKVLINNESVVLNFKVLTLVLYYIDSIGKFDRDISFELEQILLRLKWIDSYGEFDLVPYCTLRARANRDRGFSGAYDNRELENRCDVYPVAYNLTDRVFINSKFFMNYSVTTLDLVGLVIHELLQSYISMMDYSRSRQRLFLSKVLKTLIIYDRPQEAVEMLKHEVRL